MAENMTLEAQLKRRMEELASFQEVMKLITSTLELDKILEIILEVITKTLGFEFVELDLVDEGAGVVRAVRGVNISPEQIAGSVRPLDSKDIMADIVRTGKTEVIEGWDPRFNQEMFEREGHAALVRVFTPLSVRGKNIGLVEAGYNKANRARIEEDEVRMLQAFVAQAAIAIDNARLFSEMNRALEEQKRLLETIQALSTPIVPISEEILILPLVGSIDTRRAGQIMESLLEGINHYQAETVIIDITGVPVVDTSVANHLLQAAQAARLLGAQVILVGISPEIAQTIVELGIDLSDVVTRRNLQQGIAYAMEKKMKCRDFVSNKYSLDELAEFVVKNYPFREKVAVG